MRINEKQCSLYEDALIAPLFSLCETRALSITYSADTIAVN